MISGGAWLAGGHYFCFCRCSPAPGVGPGSPFSVERPPRGFFYSSHFHGLRRDFGKLPFKPCPLPCPINAGFDSPVCPNIQIVVDEFPHNPFNNNVLHISHLSAGSPAKTFFVLLYLYYHIIGILSIYQMIFYR